MAQAAEQDTAHALPDQLHFVISEQGLYRLERLANVVRGLTHLAHDDPRQARHMVEIAREDVSAIFALIGEQVEQALTEVTKAPGGES